MAIKRRPNEVARDRRLIASLYLQGMIQTEIAKWVGVSQSIVSRDLKAIQELWQQRSVMDMDKHKQAELAKIDLLEMTYWEGYIKSTNALVHTTILDHDTQEWVVETVEIEGVEPGDPRFLAGVRGCVKDRREMFGLDAAGKLELTGEDGDALAIRVIGGIDLDKDI